MKKSIAIVAGGDSSEIGVSLKSAEGIYSFIDKDKYDLHIAIVKHDEWSVVLADGQRTPIDKNNFSFMEGGTRKRFDFAYITIHGTPGENGLLQGYFDLIGLPYSTCNVLVSALTFNKHACKNFLRSFDVCVADAVQLFRNDAIDEPGIIARLGLPVFVKPNDGGSSFGITKVKDAAELCPAIEKAFAEGDEVLIEAFIDGMEVTCGCYKTQDKEVVFPLTEVVSKNEFFDFEAKYNGASDEITPARISDELTRSIQAETLRIYQLLGAKGLIRVDYIVPPGREPVMLEINTTPGMTATSFIPQQVKAAGLEMKDVMNDIIENELK